MSILAFSKLSKSYVTDEIFNDISFLIDEKDKIGLVGNNGCGKSTLLKIIAGIESYDSGTINMQKDLSISYLDQAPEFDDEESVLDVCLREFEEEIAMEEDLEDLALKMETEKGEALDEAIHAYSDLMEKFKKRDGFAYRSLVRGLLIGFGFEEEEFNTRIRDLSGGQKSRLELASLLLKKPDLLLLDEPTNHLDMEAISFLENFLKSYDGAVIIVSHDRYFLDKVINRVFHIENKCLEIYETDYTGFVRRREERLAAQMKKYQKQQKEIAKQEEIIERFSNYGRDRYKKQAESRKKMLDRLDLVDMPKIDSTNFGLHFDPVIQSGIDVIEYDQVGKSFGGNKILENISFDLKRGEKIGIIGANGVGKTTLIKMITGDIYPDEGEVIVGSNVMYAYYDQEQDNLDLDNLLIDEVLDAEEDMTISKARNYLGSFNFRDEDVFKEVRDLSGGEKGRLSLLKLMLKRPNLLLMDEPTNHLDIESKEILEKALNEYTASFLVVSHDRYFLNKVCNKIVLIEKDKATMFYGNYDYYIEKTRVEENESEKKGNKTALKKDRKKLEASKKELRKIRSDYNKLEKEISSLEEDLDELKDLSYKPEVYTDYEKAQDIADQIRGLEEKIEDYTNQWFELSEYLED